MYSTPPRRDVKQERFWKKWKMSKMLENEEKWENTKKLKNQLN